MRTLNEASMDAAETEFGQTLAFAIPTHHFWLWTT